MKAWLFIGAKVVCVKRGLWRHAITGKIYWKWWREPRRGRVYVVTGVEDGERLKLVGFADGATYDVSRFRPVSTTDTTHQVEAMKRLMRDARGKVPA